MYKQLVKQIFQNKVFLILLLLLTMLTSLSFFFVRFSIDGNMAVLQALQASQNLTENQMQYKVALNSNTSLAYTFLASLTGLTAFVFVMFFYRFFRSNRKQIGCLKSLGFKDDALRNFFVLFTAVISIIGALLGLLGGYFMSDILINANTVTYGMSGLAKSVSPLSMAAGLGVATVIFSLTAYICYFFIRGKEAGALIAGSINEQGNSAALRLADAVSRIIPVKDKFPLRIALRKPIAVVLVIIAVMSFSVCMIIGNSLNISSRQVFDSQTIGHNYEYDVKYNDVRLDADAGDGAVRYLELPGTVVFGSNEIEQNIIALCDESKVFTLQDNNRQPVSLPHKGALVVGPGLIETYGLRTGDTVTVTVGNRTVQLEVQAEAANAKSASVYVNADELTQILELPPGAYNGELRNTVPNEVSNDTKVITREERIADLRRNAVSNNVSAVINQVTGALVGCILIFLALYVNFQDNTRDMLILHMMGYRIGAIRKMLVNVYLPILWAAFVVTLAPSIGLAQSIQRSLSIATGDFMPFGTSIWVVALVFILLNIIYLLVQAVFSLGIKRIIKREDITEYTSTE